MCLFLLLLHCLIHKEGKQLAQLVAAYLLRQYICLLFCSPYLVEQGERSREEMAGWILNASCGKDGGVR